MPNVGHALLRLARALDELGSDGLAVEANSGGVHLGNQRYEPLWAEADRRRAVIFVHSTFPRGSGMVALGRPRRMIEFLLNSARTIGDLLLSGVLERYKNIRCIFTHGGGVWPLLPTGSSCPAPRFPATNLAPSLPVSCCSDLWYDLAGMPFPHQVPALTAAFGPRSRNTRRRAAVQPATAGQRRRPAVAVQPTIRPRRSRRCRRRTGPLDPPSTTAERLFDVGTFTFSVAGVGYPAQIQMAPLSLMLGGNIRVGLEDNLRVSRTVTARIQWENLSSEQSNWPSVRQDPGQPHRRQGMPTCRERRRRMVLDNAATRPHQSSW